MAGCYCLDRHSGDISDNGFITLRSRCKNPFKIRFGPFEDGFLGITSIDRRFFG